MSTSNLLFGWISGWKTYIVGIAMIILGFYNNNYELVMEGLGLMALRAGIAKIKSS